MILPSKPSNELFHKPVNYKRITILGIRFPYITFYYIGQTSGKLLGCQEQPLLKRYAYNLNMFLNRSISNIHNIYIDIQAHATSLLGRTSVSIQIDVWKQKLL